MKIFGFFSDKVDELGVCRGRGEGRTGGGAPGVLEGGRLRGKGREREKNEGVGGKRGPRTPGGVLLQS